MEGVNDQSDIHYMHALINLLTKRLGVENERATSGNPWSLEKHMLVLMGVQDDVCTYIHTQHCEMVVLQARIFSVISRNNTFKLIYTPHEAIVTSL